jgi:pyruvate dehydrogenase E1 component beta subunit
MQATEALVQDGYDPEIIDLISLKPLDIQTVARSIKKTHKVIIVEECMKTGGIGAELIAQINDTCFNDLDAQILRLSSQDIPTPYNGKLEKATVIHPRQIIDAATYLCALDT